MTDVAAFLHSVLPQHRDLLPADVDWIDIDAGAVASAEAGKAIGVASFARLACKLAGKAGAPIRRQLDELCARGGRLVLCSDDTALALAVAYRKLWGRPIVPMRLADAEGMRAVPGQFGVWFRNRGCYANIAVSLSAFRILRAHRDGRHRLLSLVSPMSDEPEAARELLRNAVEIVGRPPGGDQHIRLACVTHFYVNQNNPDSVFDLLRHYATYDPGLLDRVHFVVVDDGSPLQYEIPDLDLNLTWLRIDQDIRWNQPGARNLGMMYARADDVFISDVDIEVPEHSLAYFANRGHCGKWMYRPMRRDQGTGEELGRHPNAFLLSRGRFLRFFGYDEDFSGNYAFDDLRFTKDQKLQGTVLARLPAKWFVYERTKIDRKGSYHSLVRDESTNALLNARKTFEYEWYGRHGGHSRKNLQFTWTVLADRRRARPAPAIDRLFKLMWYLRQISPN